MKNKGLFSTLFIRDIREEVGLDDAGRGRMATLAQQWLTRDDPGKGSLWDSFLKQAVSYLQFAPLTRPSASGVYQLFDDYAFSNLVAILYLVPADADLDDVSIGRFWPGRLVAELKQRTLIWGILTNGSQWRLYSLKTAKPHEDYVELDLAETLKASDEKEYALFERFFHRDSFTEAEEPVRKKGKEKQKVAPESADAEATDEQPDALFRCRLDYDAERSEEILGDLVKAPLLSQVDEVLQYLCNGFIADTERKGAEYTEEERRSIFESAVKLLYRCLFLFYAEARSLLPSEPDKAEAYRKLSIRHLCEESRKFRWNQRKDTDGYGLWKHLKGLANAVNDGDQEYGIMGYNGGLFDDTEEKFLGKHKLRNDFLARALYLLAYVEPWDNDPETEYEIPYEDLEVRHLGELYENILEFTVMLADADRIRRRTKKGISILLASDTTYQQGDTRIKKGDVFFGETALERKQSGSYYTPEVLVQFLNQKAIINPLRERFDNDYRKRFGEFCKEAAEGRDPATSRGAAQSAIALVDRYVQDVMLKFKMCDPGMGSGHFLVNAANQMSDLVVELLAEIPHVEGLKSKVTCAPNHWRRLITRHCVYGVDLNPLAVHLAKLSLWLNCFAQDHRLTFLDHHLKCGNSLIGIRTLDQLEKIPERAKAKKRKTEQGLLFPMDLKKAYSRAVVEIQKIEKMDEDATDKMKELLADAWQESVGVIALADLFTTCLIDHTIDEEDYREMFSDLARQQKPTSILAKEILASIKTLRARHHFFHWGIEFPEVFASENPGFDATTGNPPWDVLEPDSQEFFSAYDSEFRKLPKQDALRRIEHIKSAHPAIADKWAAFEKTVYEASAYCKEPGAYRALAKGKIDLYKAFLERFQQLLRDSGRIGIVCPSGFYTDEGAVALRMLFFQSGHIECLYCFENRRAIFNIHRSFKFVLLCFERGPKSGTIKCSFMHYDPELLPLIESQAVALTTDQIKRFSPGSLNVLEISSQRDVDILARCHDQHPSLGDSEELDIYQELNITADAALLNSIGTGWPLYEGKHIWLFDAEFAAPRFWIRKDLSDHFVRRRYLNTPLRGPTEYRACFRGVAAATNERTLASTILPPEVFCEVKCTCIAIDHPQRAQFLLQVVALLNSILYDFNVRLRVTNNVSVFLVKQLPWPRFLSNLQSSIYARAARLVCTTNDFAALWEEVFDPQWQSQGFWYPNRTLTAYGPEHEQLLRQQLAREATTLTPKWTNKCGVHDRLPDRRDTGNRAQLRAEIDAYVAHLYGISRDDFAYILDTFPVLKRKEEKAFGEYRSKRKCLEEFDRLAPILESIP